MAEVTNNGSGLVDDGWSTPQPLSPKCNFTDPIVRHDPTIGKPTIVQENKADKTIKTGKEYNNSDVDWKKIEGSKIPVILYNNMVLRPDQIDYMYIDYDAFTPSIVLTFHQNNKGNEILDNPGQDNKLIVIFTPPIDASYKPVALPFYMTDIKYEDDNITVYGTYKMMALEVPMTKQITFNPYGPGNPGCQSTYCMLPENDHPTTFEFLHYIAVTELKLGYATTDGVKEIKDDKTRLLMNENYAQAIQKHTAFGGLNKDSIFDSWIDLYQYLVVVNVPWVMSQKVGPNDLSINPVIGPDNTDNSLPEQEDKGPIHRMLTNNQNFAQGTNMIFSAFKWETSNREVYENGNSSQLFVGSPVGVDKGNNSVQQTDVNALEDSIDGLRRSDKYKFMVQKNLGFECGSTEDKNTPVLLQKQLHDAYFQKLRAKRLKIIMDTPNLGLQRGTLVWILIYEYSVEGKRNIFQNLKNLYGDVSDIPDEPSEWQNKVIHDINVGIPDMAISGLYYIDGMGFEYSDHRQNITQYLFLIKNGPLLNYMNTTTLARSFHNLASYKDE